MSSLAASELAELAPSWELSLRAAGRSVHTVKLYLSSLRMLLEWCEGNGHAAEPLTRAAVIGWGAWLAETGREPATIRSRQAAVRAFSRWLTAEGEMDADPLTNLPAPRIPQKVIQPLTDDQIRAMLKTCDLKTFAGRRDAAIIRFMAETGARAGEVIALSVSDVDPMRGVATIRRGKGGKGRVVPFGPQTAQALDRYLRSRKTHRLAKTPALWLGDRGRGFGYSGLSITLARRADDAGVTGFHPHLLRHTAAHRWLAAGGSEDGLMAVAGWSTHKMLERYTRARRAERAAAEARALNLGEF